MPPKKLVSSRFGSAVVEVYASEADMGSAAAARAASIIQAALESRGRARVMVGTGNSQLSVIKSLTEEHSLDWSRITVFHMDEYVGIQPDHPASFRNWLKLKVTEKCRPAVVHYIAGDAPDVGMEIARYGRLLAEAPLDLAFVGFGENGHIAFNDPAFADFSDPAILKIVTLDDVCRRQQVGEGHFKNLAAVPEHAISVTCSELLRAKTWVSCVPESRKAQAVRNALEGPISTACPASIVRTHPHAHVFLDSASATLLAKSASPQN